MPKEQLKTLSEQMYFVLLALCQELSGVEISEYIQTLTKGRVLLGPGTLYSILAKFEEEKLIIQTRCVARQKWYRISAKGKTLLLCEFERLQSIIEESKGVL